MASKYPAEWFTGNLSDKSDAPYPFYIEIAGKKLVFQVEKDRDWLWDGIKERHGGTINAAFKMSKGTLPTECNRKAL